MGYWRCPVCGERDGDHTYWCKVTDEKDLEWVEEDD